MSYIPDNVANDNQKPQKIKSYWQEVKSRLWHNRPAMLSLSFIILLIISAIIGPFITRHTYYDQNLKLSNIAPYFEVYEAKTANQEPTYFFMNQGNFKLYEVSKNGELKDILRAKRRDMINKKNIYQFGETQVILNYSSLPVQLQDAEENPLQSIGTWWNKTYLFGTDSLGRDILVRLLYGARISLTVAFVATFVNFFIGIFYGGISGYLGGMTDAIMMRIVEIISTIPLTLYVILIMVVLESGLLAIIIAIGSVFWVDMARIVRGQVLSLKTLDYVASAETMGANMWQILIGHLLPNAMGPILVTMTLLIPSAIFIESFMSFIGLGVSVPMASWGTLTAEAVETLRSYPYQLFFPATAISLTMFAFNFLGDGLRDAMDPKLNNDN
ncbi:MAG: peptide ABC transporter permease [Hyphomicrobiales bacterium]|nr:MAG: peptide ABC transporter permease [Hyphomicrobiales bacterium]